VRVQGLPADQLAANLPARMELVVDGKAEEYPLVWSGIGGGGWYLARPGAPTQPLVLLAPTVRAWTSPTDEVRLLGALSAATPTQAAGYARTPARSITANSTPLASASPSPSKLALEARLVAAGNRSLVEAQTYLESQGYYDDEPGAAPDRPPLTTEEVRGWSLLAYGRPAHLAWILFADICHGQVVFADLPIYNFKGYTVSRLGERPQITLGRDLKPVRAAAAMMDALGDFLAQAPTREQINLLYAEQPLDRRFTPVDRDQLAATAFKTAWRNGLTEIATLLEAEAETVRVVYSPLDVSITVIEATQGSRSALFSTLLNVTPVNKVSGFVRRLTRYDKAIVTFGDALSASVRQVLKEPGRIKQLQKAEEFMNSGVLARSEWVTLVDRGIFKIKDPRKAARAAKLAADGLNAKPAGKVLHHYLPLEIEDFFLHAGIDPNDPRFTAWVDSAKHIGWHAGAGKGGKYNEIWRDYMRLHPTATAAQIVSELGVVKLGYVP
jgi:hypothetical protein